MAHVCALNKPLLHHQTRRSLDSYSAMSSKMQEKCYEVFIVQKSSFIAAGFIPSSLCAWLDLQNFSMALRYSVCYCLELRWPITWGRHFPLPGYSTKALVLASCQTSTPTSPTGKIIGTVV